MATTIRVDGVKISDLGTGADNPVLPGDIFPAARAGTNVRLLGSDIISNGHIVADAAAKTALLAPPGSVIYQTDAQRLFVRGFSGDDVVLDVHDRIIPPDVGGPVKGQNLWSAPTSQTTRGLIVTKRENVAIDHGFALDVTNEPYIAVYSGDDPSVTPGRYGAFGCILDQFYMFTGSGISQMNLQNKTAMALPLVFSNQGADPTAGYEGVGTAIWSRGATLYARNSTGGLMLLNPQVIRIGTTLTSFIAQDIIAARGPGLESVGMAATAALGTLTCSTVDLLISCSTSTKKVRIGSGTSPVQLEGNTSLAVSSTLRFFDTAAGSTQLTVADATGAGDVVAQLNALLAALRTYNLMG